MKKIFFIFIISLLIMTGGKAWGQVILTGTSYTQDFDIMGTSGASTPQGWSTATNATGTTLGTTSTVLATGTNSYWSNTTLGAKNVASLDVGGSTTNANQIIAADRALSIRQTATGDPGAAFILTIANTTNFQNFSGSFKLQQVENSTAERITTWKVQCSSNGTTWIDANTAPTTLTTQRGVQSNQNVTFTLDNAIDNLSSNVHIRIVALTAATSSGSRAHTAIDDFVLNYQLVQTCTTKPSFDSFTVTQTSANTYELEALLDDGFEGDCELTAYGFQYSTDASFATDVNTVNSQDIDYDEGYLLGILDISALPCNKTYYVRAYAINGKGTEYIGDNTNVITTAPCTLLYTVTFSNEGEEFGLPIQQSAYNEPIILPSTVPVSACSDWIFAGWATAETAGDVTVAPTLYAAGASYTPNATQTLYAVYKKVGETKLLTNAEIGDIATSTTYNAKSIPSLSGTWTGWFATNNTSSLKHIQMRANADGTHLASPTFAKSVSQIKIQTCSYNGNSPQVTASGRSFYIMSSSNTVAQPSSGDYGTGTVPSDNGLVTINLTGNPTSFKIYSSAGSGISSINVILSTIYNSNPNCEPECDIDAPTAIAASFVSETSFTANWNASAGASKYKLTVYTKVTPVELVKNGGFEIGDKTDWYGNAGAATHNPTDNNFNYYDVVNTDAYNSIYSIHRTQPAGTGATARLEQDIPTEAGKTYAFSFWYKDYTGTGDTNGNCFRDYSLINASDGGSYINKDAGTGPGKLPASTTAWTKYEKTFIATGAKMRISLRSYEPVRIDDISLVLTPTIKVYDNIVGTSQVVTGLLAGETYYYTVQAYGDDVCSAVLSGASNEIEVTTIGNLIVENTQSVTITGNKTYNDVVVEPGGKLTIALGATLTANSLTLESDENGNGTFINYGTIDIPIANVHQYLSTTGNNDGRRWYYLSSPVENAKVDDVFNKTDDGVFAHSEDGAFTYNNVQGYTTKQPLQMDEPGHVMVKGNGYAAYIGTASPTYTFTGKLNDGEISVEITRTGTEAGKRGFNLIGNPYPAYLEWEKVTLPDNVKTTIWTRTFNKNLSTGEKMHFVTYNAMYDIQLPTEEIANSRHIAPMQAFWVRIGTAEETTPQTVGNIVFDNTYLSHRLSSDYGIIRAPRADNNKVLFLNLSNGTNSDQTVLVFSSIAADGLDRYDSEKMSNSDKAIPEIYTIVDNSSLAINGMNTLPMNTEIPLGFRTGMQGGFEISATEIRNFADLEIILKDNNEKEGGEFNLTTGETYRFTSDAIDNTSRFSIIFREPTGFTNNTIGNIVIFANGNSIVIKVNNKLLGETVSVFNTIGQKFVETSIIGESTVINNVPAGVYLVKIGNKTEKIIIK